MTETRHDRADTLVTQVSRKLRADIDRGIYMPGDKLPSEAQLTLDYAVSRTVVREAIASLRSDGLVEARRGSGVYVLEPAEATDQPFTNLNVEKISSVIELLELRSACEIEAAGLAASRRSASQMDEIVAASRKVSACLQAGMPTRDADFELHLAVANATNNPRFGELLRLLRSGIIPRGELQGAAVGQRPLDYNISLQEEHDAIIDAILDGDVDAAREAMRRHLKGSLRRYRDLLRRGRTDPTAGTPLGAEISE
jgi:GntR family transcriptional regulator, transcriptional repressor for pyruvate dehydrogenase complex